MKKSANNSSFRRLKISLGFTLIELIVTIAVLAIIISIAAPNISLQLANQRIKSTTATLENVLKEARSESVIYRIPIMVGYDNGDSNSINIKVPYSGPPLYFSSTANFDWTNLFFNSAVASSSRPSGKPSQGDHNNNEGNNDNEGSNNSEGNNNNEGSNNNEGNNDNPDSGNDIPENGKDPEGGEENKDTSGDNSDLDIEWVIAKNYNYSDKSIIKSSDDTIIFKPSKQANHSMTYTICDTNKSARPRQVTVSKLGIIISKLGGSC